MKLHPATLWFLEEINRHNSRKYFASIRDLYDDIHKNLLTVAQEFLQEAKKYHDWYEDTNIKDCLYRIYRDARRLKPWDQIYKSNFGIIIGPNGKKTQQPAYYLHIQPWNNSFFAAWLYRPEKEQLENLRRYLSKHWDLYMKELTKKEIKKNFSDVELAKLKKPPKWFSPEDKYIEIIKMKQHMIRTPISDKELLEMDITDYFKKQLKLLWDWMHILSEWLLYTKQNRDWKFYIVCNK